MQWIYISEMYKIKMKLLFTFILYNTDYNNNIIKEKIYLVTIYIQKHYLIYIISFTSNWILISLINDW